MATGLVMAFGLSPEDLVNLLAKTEGLNAEEKTILLLYQGVLNLFLFGGTGYLFLKRQYGIGLNGLGNTKLPLHFWGLASLICFSGIIINSGLEELNKSIDLSLIFGKEFFEYSKATEEQLFQLTKNLVLADSLQTLFIGFLVIAIIPAIAEEILFRGVMQNLLHKYSDKIHLSIWVTAIVFGIIHFQFLSLFPRVFLGAIFGYLYYYSGNFKLAVLGHLINNGSVFLYANFLHWRGEDPFSTEEFNYWLLLLFIPLFIWSFNKFKGAQNLATESGGH